MYKESPFHLATVSAIGFNQLWGRHVPRMSEIIEAPILHQHQGHTESPLRALMTRRAYRLTAPSLYYRVRGRLPQYGCCGPSLISRDSQTVLSLTFHNLDPKYLRLAAPIWKMELAPEKHYRATAMWLACLTNSTPACIIWTRPYIVDVRSSTTLS